MDTLGIAEARGDQVAISSITLVEVTYLVEKRRIDPAAFAGLIAALDRSDPTLLIRSNPLKRVAS